MSRWSEQQRLDAIADALAAIAPTCVKSISADDVDALADTYQRQFRQTPIMKLLDAIDSWSMGTERPQALPTPGQVWRHLRRVEAAADSPQELFGGTAPASGVPAPPFVAEVKRRADAIALAEPPPHRHHMPRPGIDPTDGCAACDFLADRRLALLAMLDEVVPNTQHRALSNCKGCDGSGLVLVTGPWLGTPAEQEWARCPVCNAIEPAA